MQISLKSEYHYMYGMGLLNRNENRPFGQRALIKLTNETLVSFNLAYGILQTLHPVLPKRNINSNEIVVKLHQGRIKPNGRWLVNTVETELEVIQSALDVHIGARHL